MYQAVDKEAMKEEARKQNSTIDEYHKGVVLYSQDGVRGVQEMASFIHRTSTYVYRTIVYYRYLNYYNYYYYIINNNITIYHIYARTNIIFFFFFFNFIYLYIL